MAEPLQFLSNYQSLISLSTVGESLSHPRERKTEVKKSSSRATELTAACAGVFRVKKNNKKNLHVAKSSATCENWELGGRKRLGDKVFR